MTIFEEVEKSLKGEKECSLRQAEGNALIVSFFDTSQNQREQIKRAYNILLEYGGENFIISVIIKSLGFYQISLIEKYTGDSIRFGSIRRALHPTLEDLIYRSPLQFPIELRLSVIGEFHLRGLMISGIQILK